MGIILSEIYDNVVTTFFKGAIFKEYYELYRQGAYKEAYTVLREIVNNHTKWLKKGDPYVTFAKLEILANNDNDAAMKLLGKAKEIGCSDMATYYGILAEVYWRKGNNDKCIECYEKSVELEPNIIALRHLGKALSLMNDKHAINIWERTLKKYPKDCVALAYLAREAEKAGDNEKALMMYKKADEYTHKEDDIYEMARIYYWFGKYQESLKLLLKCEEKNYKRQNVLLTEIAFCYLQLDNFESAIIYADKALDVKFDDDYAKRILLQCSEKQLNATLLHDIVSKHPDSCLSYLLLALEANHNNDFPKIEEYLSKAIELEPSLVERYNIARLYHFIENYDKAINYYLECEKLGYAYPSHLYVSIAICYFALESEKSAIEYSIKALELDFNENKIKDELIHYTIENSIDTELNTFLKKHSQTSLAYIIYAHEACIQKNIQVAREFIEKAQELHPSLIEKFYIAWQYFDFEDFQKALDIFQESEQSGFEDKFRLYHAFAWCYYELKEYESALNYAEKVLSIEPDNEEAKEIMYECKGKIGDFGDTY